MLGHSSQWWAGCEDNEAQEEDCVASCYRLLHWRRHDKQKRMNNTTQKRN